MILKNPWRRRGLPDESGMAEGEIVTDPSAAKALYARCPEAAATPLADASDLAAALGVGRLFVKDERSRMGLGSFKALGAAHAIAKRAAAAGGKLEGETFCCASAGNHGLSVAAGARVFDAASVIYIAETVPEAFAGRLRAEGATVVREGAEYEASMAAAMARAEAEGWTLLPDSSWPGETDAARDVMEGYLIMGEEVAAAIEAPPTHVFLQAGVGGLAAAAAASARRAWGDAPFVTIVEPSEAPALIASIEAGRFVTAKGGVSSMGRLDCKEASHLALRYLARVADAFMTITDGEAEATAERLAGFGFATTPSGAGGLAGLEAAAREGALGLGPDSVVLAYLSEGPEDA